MKKVLAFVIIMFVGLTYCGTSNLPVQESNISDFGINGLVDSTTQQLEVSTSKPPSSPPPTRTTLPPTKIVSSQTATNLPPTNTNLPPTETTLPPTETKLPPTETKLPPTATTIPPTQTGKPATSTPRPSTPTNKPPTTTKIPATQTKKPNSSISECRSYSSGKVTCMIKRAYCSYQSGVNGSPTFCNDAPYPSHSFTYVVWGQDVSFLNGHCIVIKGNIQYYNGKPEISWQSNDGFVKYCD